MGQDGPAVFSLFLDIGLSCCTITLFNSLLMRRHAMRASHRLIFRLLLGGLIIFSISAPSSSDAGSQDRKNPVAPSSGSASSEPDGSVTNAPPLSRPSQSAPRPGPAWKTIGGTVTHIKGEVYTVEDYDGNQVQLYVSRETKRLRGQKKVGDRVRIEITRDGFANSIQ